MFPHVRVGSRVALPFPFLATPFPPLPAMFGQVLATPEREQTGGNLLKIGME
jgi:hypothetical protein